MSLWSVGGDIQFNENASLTQTIIGVQNQGWLVSSEEGCRKAGTRNLRDVKKKGYRRGDGGFRWKL